MVMTTALTMSEAAEQLACSERTVRRLVHDGRLAHLRVGRLVRIRPADLDAFTARSMVGPMT